MIEYYCSREQTCQIFVPPSTHFQDWCMHPRNSDPERQPSRNGVSPTISRLEHWTHSQDCSKQLQNLAASRLPSSSMPREIEYRLKRLHSRTRRDARRALCPTSHRRAAALSHTRTHTLSFSHTHSVSFSSSLQPSRHFISTKQRIVSVTLYPFCFPSSHISTLSIFE